MKNKDSLEHARATRAAVEKILPWIRQPQEVPRPAREDVAAAVRLSAELLALNAPGHSVEVRVPPFIAVHCVEGSAHRRGTPAHWVQCDPVQWLRLVIGVESLGSSTASAVSVESVESAKSVEVSSAHAGRIAEFLPLLRF